MSQASPLYGCDINRFRSAINLATAQAGGIDFVIAKVGQGSSTSMGYGQTLDIEWPNFRAEAQAIDLPLGGYWYVGDTESAASQASRCVSWIGDQAIPLALDWEEGGGNWSNLTGVLSAFAAAGLTVRMLYTRKTFYDANGGGDIAALGLTLWSARYPGSGSGTPSALYANVTPLGTYWQSYGGVTATILQFSDNSTIGGTSPVDADAFSGTLGELQTLLAPMNPAPPAPSEPGAFLSFFPDRVVI